MARAGKTEEAAGEKSTAAKSEDLSRLTPEPKLNSLLKAARATKRETTKISGAYGETIQKAIQDHHLHRAAFTSVVKEDRMEPEELADFYAQQEYYRDALGLNKRAEDATKNMQFGPGEEKTEDETPPVRDPKVRAFPTPAGVAAT